MTTAHAWNKVLAQLLRAGDALAAGDYRIYERMSRLYYPYFVVRRNGVELYNQPVYDHREARADLAAWLVDHGVSVCDVQYLPDDPIALSLAGIAVYEQLELVLSVPEFKPSVVEKPAKPKTKKRTQQVEFVQLSLIA
jgi:hypothetical protein